MDSWPAQESANGFGSPLIFQPAGRHRVPCGARAPAQRVAHLAGCQEGGGGGAGGVCPRAAGQPVRAGLGVNALAGTGPGSGACCIAVGWAVTSAGLLAELCLVGKHAAPSHPRSLCSNAAGGRTHRCLLRHPSHSPRTAVCSSPTPTRSFRAHEEFVLQEVEVSVVLDVKEEPANKV